MGAVVKICRKRTACAVLASGVVISLTALTGGVAPAFAKPGDDPADPSTTVLVPEPEAPAQQSQPEQQQPEQQQRPVERPTAAEVPSPNSGLAPTAVAPVAPAPVQQQPVVAPPRVRAPEPAPVQEKPVEAPTPTAAADPTPSATNPTPIRQAPSSSSTRASVAPTIESPASQAPASRAPASQAPASQEPASQAPGSESPSAPAPTPSDASTAPSPGLVAPGSAAGDSSASSASPTTEADESTASSRPSEASESSARSSARSAAPSESAAARVIEKVEPQTLVAPEEDVRVAKSAKIIEEKPEAAPKKDIDDISKVIDVRSLDRDRRDQNGSRDDDRDFDRRVGDRDWDRNVRQWRPDWVEYDEYYRPVLSNPYRNPVRIVYIYQNAPRIVWIPPLARIVLEVAQFAAYSFTALVTNPINQVLNVAVGSFFGGGYNPGFGLPLPPPPPPLLNYANVPVQVRYSDATYEPFRVQKIVDVGDDARYGERKVLLDGVTPAWGRWTQTASGERSFEVHKTQQFPGLDDPREAPLPGDYQLRLAADESSSGMNKRDVYLVAVAIASGALSLGAVLLSVLLGRRKRMQH